VPPFRAVSSALREVLFMSEDQGATVEGAGPTGSPAPVETPDGANGSILTTQEGRFVSGLARVLALAQCLGLGLLVALLVRYHAQVLSDVVLAGMGTDFPEVTEQAQQTVSPSILLVPVLVALIASVSWGLWLLRPWARRLAVAMALVLIAGGVCCAHWAITASEPASYDSEDLNPADIQETKDLLVAASVLAGFYGITLGLLLLPTVGRVFTEATREDRAVEKRFTIKKDAPRSHFEVEHEVEQL
jgi:hypothetical protein